jgi:DNA uptake protein ComE-like DNA-binding protein
MPTTDGSDCNLTTMKLHRLSSVSLILLASSSLLTFTACSGKQDNPNEIRERTAQATETVRRDTKAVVEGVKEGMRSDKAININKASREDLLTLPGITEHDADRIIAARPFDDAHDLVNRHIVSQTEYDKINDRVIAGH